MECFSEPLLCAFWGFFLLDRSHSESVIAYHGLVDQPDIRLCSSAALIL